MKKIILLMGCIAVLSGASIAESRELLLLKQGNLVFASVLDMYHYNQILMNQPVGDYRMITEHINDLIKQNKAFYTSADLKVYVFDQYSIGYTATAARIKTEDETVIGWVNDMHLEKIKKKQIIGKEEKNSGKRNKEKSSREEILI
jgi:hypothetical protein